MGRIGVRIEAYCPPEVEAVMRSNAEANVEENFIKKKIISSEELRKSQITFIAVEGAKEVKVHVLDCWLDTEAYAVLADTTYASFGEQHAVKVIDGSTGRIVTERKCFEPVGA